MVHHKLAFSGERRARHLPHEVGNNLRIRRVERQPFQMSNVKDRTRTGIESTDNSNGSRVVRLSKINTDNVTLIELRVTIKRRDNLGVTQWQRRGQSHRSVPVG